MAVRDWLQLALTAGIGPVLIRRLIEKTGSAEAACSASIALLRTVEGIGSASAGKIADSLKSAAAEVDAELQRAESAGAAIICPDDESYPALLKEIPDPPAVLYVRGKVASLGADCVEKPMTAAHLAKLEELLERAGFALDAAGFRRYGSARQLYNFHVDHAGRY